MGAAHVLTRAQLIALLSGVFFENFADEAARAVRDADAVGLLYEAATSAHDELPRDVRHKVLFRGAYVLEKVFFDDPAAFAPFADAFCRTGFPACTDPSARRHFTKIMARLLQDYTPGPECLDRIAQSAAEWMVDPEAKVAVRVNALDVLKVCRHRVPWVADAWDDLRETLSRDATPGIRSRLRKTPK